MANGLLSLTPTSSDRRTALWRLRCVRPRLVEEGSQRGDAYSDQRNRDRQGDHSHGPARSLTYCDAPLGAKQIQTVSEMPRCRRDADHVKSCRPGVLQLHLHFVKRRLLVSQQVYAAKAHGVGMPPDIDESDGAGPALR